MVLVTLATNEPQKGPGAAWSLPLPLVCDSEIIRLAGAGGQKLHKNEQEKPRVG